MKRDIDHPQKDDKHKQSVQSFDDASDNIEYATSLRNRFRFGQHHGIEVRAAAVGIALVLFVGGYSIATYQGYQYDVKQEELTTPLSSSDLAFSHDPNATVSLQPLVRSRVGNVVYIPFSIGSMQNLSTSADDYKLYIIPTRRFATLQKFKAELVLFGTTGNACIKLSSDEPIKPQTIQIALISNKNLSATDQSGESNDLQNNTTNQKGLQSLESKYNMVDFSSNPGAERNVREQRIASGATWSDVYNMCFADTQRRAIYNKIDSQKTKIEQYKETANSYRERLEKMGYQVPKNPNFWNDDWRPANTVNIHTGMMKSGIMATDAIANGTVNSNNGSNNSSADVADLNKMPQYLDNPRLGKNAMYNADQEIQNNNQNNNNQTNNQQQQNNDDPYTMWTTLKNQWQQILNAKQTIYITDHYGLYQINNEMKQNAMSGVSVQSQKHVTIKRTTE